MGERGSNSTATPKSRRRVWVLVASGAGLVAGVLLMMGRFEPSYKGESASFWLNERLNSAAVPARDVAEAFKGMGPKGRSFLIRTMKGKPSRSMRRAREFADGHHFPDWFTDHLPDGSQTERLRVGAVQIAGEMGPQAAALLPTLMEVLRENDEDSVRPGYQIVPYVAAEALRSLGEVAAPLVPELMENVKGTNGSLAYSSIGILGAIGPKALAAEPLLKATIGRRDLLALAAAEAMLKINKETNFVVEACTSMLVQLVQTNRVDYGLQVQTLRVLENQLGAAAKPAGPAIQAALFATRGVARVEAEKALTKIDPALWQATLEQLNGDIPARVDQLLKIIQSRDERRAPDAMLGLRLLGPQAASAVPTLMDLLSPEEETASDLDSASGGVSLQKRAALVRRTMDARTRDNLRIGAAMTLAEIGPEARAAVPKIIVLMRAGIERQQSVESYMNALAGFGPEAREATPVLEELLMSGDPSTHLAAAEALSRIEPELGSNAAAILQGFLERISPAALKAEVQSGSTGLRLNAAHASIALWRLRLKETPPVKELMDLYPGAWGEKGTILQLLGEIGPAAREATPMLVEIVQLKQPLADASQRLQAAIALRKIDPEEARRVGLPGTLVLP